MPVLSNSIPDGITAESLPFFEAALQHDTFMVDRTANGANLTTFLYLSLHTETKDPEVYKVHRAHDLAVLAVRASGGLAKWDAIVAGLNTHLGVDVNDADFALRHSLAINTLELRLGAMLVSPETSF